MEADSRDSQILVLLPFAASTTPSLSELRKAQALIAEIRQGSNGSFAGEDETSLQINKIPWHISNKYYDADVHFKISTLSFSPPKALVKRPEQRAAANGAIESAASGRCVEEDDEALKRRVRDVFEALNSPSPNQRSKGEGTTSTNEPTWGARLFEEREGVDAVMMIVDSGAPTQQHKALLQKLNTMHESSALLSGFDLSISMVVALPPALDDQGGASSHVIPAFQEVYELYAGEGWEYVDIGQLVSGDDAFSDDEAELGPTHSDSGELQGIERIREALETHTWPGLSRKGDKGRDRRGQDIQEIESSAGAHFANPSNDGRDLDQILQSLKLGSNAGEAASYNAETTEHDEKLARDFLKSILQSQLSSSQDHLASEDSDLPPTRSLKMLQDELESFLESKDAKWPKGDITQTVKEDNTDAWQMGRDGVSAPLQEPAFDDDFSDFVVPSNASFTNADRGSNSAFGEEDDDLDIDDIAFLKALEDDPGQASASKGDGDDAELMGMRLESSFSAIIAQAERVRSIQNPEKRRDEAARIALAMVREPH